MRPPWPELVLNSLLPLAPKKAKVMYDDGVGFRLVNDVDGIYEVNAKDRLVTKCFTPAKKEERCSLMNTHSELGLFFF